MSPELDAAADDFERLMSGTDGATSVRAGKGCILVQVSNPSVAAEIRPSYGAAYDGHPIVVRKSVVTAGILTLYP